MDIKKSKFASIIVLNPLEDKTISYIEAKDIVRNIIGTFFEDKDIVEDKNVPVNVMVYCKYLGKSECAAITKSLLEFGIQPLILMGNTKTFSEATDCSLRL